MVQAASGVPNDGIAGRVVDLMDAFGALGAGVAIALENLFPPLPSELVLPLAGFTASTGAISLVAVLVWTTVGSVVGAVALYALGRWLGRDRLRAVVARVPLLSVADVDRAEAWFARHGDAAVLLGRMVPLVRSLVSVPAGVQRMSPVRFVVLTALGSAMWNTVFVLAGYLLGTQWPRVEPYAGAAQKLGVLVVVGATAVFCVRRVRARRAAISGSAIGVPPAQ